MDGLIAITSRFSWLATSSDSIRLQFTTGCWRKPIANAGVDVVKIKELMGHASIVTTMRYIHATEQGKRGAIVVLSEYKQQHCRKFVTSEQSQSLPFALNR
jgi:integrase